MSEREFDELIADIRRTTRIVRLASIVAWTLVALELGVLALVLLR